MDNLIQQFQSRLISLNFTFKRYLCKQINWNNRLIAIIGARGVGKTTLLLQHIKENHKDLNEVLYVSLDNLYFGKNTLSDFADEFVKLGGKYLYIDEVHKYPNWSVEIKNIYDNYPELFIVITGSSALDIHKGKGDLSRRIVIYRMNGLSFREFIKLKYGIDFKVYTLKDITENAIEIAQHINAEIKPIKLFKEYLKTGYYPFFTEGNDHYYERLEQAVNEIIETDLPAMEPIDFSAVYNIKKLLMVIAELVPFKPNVSKLSVKIGINRDTLLKYLYWLQRADLLLLLTSDTYGISKMNKPEKVYLNNSNLIYALSGDSANIGTVRETFFFNQLNVKHKITYPGKADFLVDNKFIFEIGGKNKTQKQIIGLKNAFIVADNIEYAYKNTIPVWMFGFLY
ncbi:MAG: AAA family ATPase [Salinivirgaceae bacterium]|nr:AAA family ATPase [Salinivirgaceae bacterium]